MLPVIAIVGRPNVGKSTLFNRLTRTRDAVVANVPGVTRDRHYGRGQLGGKPYLAVDTGGFEPVGAEGIYREMARQTRQALDESDAVLFIVDARAGLVSQDRAVAEELRRTGRKTYLVVNKADTKEARERFSEFYRLGIGQMLLLSAEHGGGVEDLREAFLADYQVHYGNLLPRTPIMVRSIRVEARCKRRGADTWSLRDAVASTDLAAPPDAAYWRPALDVGDVIEGPNTISAVDASVTVPDGCTATVVHGGHIIFEVNE